MARSVSLRAARPVTLHLLAAMLVLVARLLGPAMPMAQVPTGSDAGLAGFPICHAGDGPSSVPPGPATPAGHAHDCQLCPACHLAGQELLPVAMVAVLAPAPIAVGGAAGPPPATGPPHAARLAARPTGPPPLPA